MNPSYEWAVKLGQLKSGAQRDHGQTAHRVEKGAATHAEAVCGTRPRKGSVGWSEAEDAVFYPRCTACDRIS